MPCLQIFTNLTNNLIPKDFISRIIPVLSKSVQKPPEDFIIAPTNLLTEAKIVQRKFICMVSSDCALTIGGDSVQPAAVATLESIGNLSQSQNKIIAKEISAFVETELGISQDRFFLTFYDLKNYNVAKGGVTIDTLEP